ncbi:MAG: PIN domain-containing protein [Candidatus Thermoplasmatota archaeon]|nr:PIN domain-containing protein [Candidatus Thermoplasmatota archaeon]
MNTYCLDASALVIYITSQKPSKKMQRIIQHIEKKESKGIISTVTIAELHRALTRISSEDQADKYVSHIQESPIQIIPVDLQIALQASIQKYGYASAKDPFAWGDAFCLATAMIHQADALVTADSEFDKVKEIPIMKI